MLHKLSQIVTSRAASVQRRPTASRSLSCGPASMSHPCLFPAERCRWIACGAAASLQLRATRCWRAGWTADLESLEGRAGRPASYEVLCDLGKRRCAERGAGVPAAVGSAEVDARHQGLLNRSAPPQDDFDEVFNSVGKLASGRVCWRACEGNGAGCVRV